MTQAIPKIAVVGGTQYIGQTYYDIIARSLDELCKERGWITEEEPEINNFLPQVTVISAGLKGIDALAVDWAVSRFCTFTAYLPKTLREYENFDPFDPALVPIYRGMLKEGKPNYVVIFPGGEIAKRLAEEEGIEIIEASIE